ncbi:MAG: arsenate reductase ArsC [Candidatus Thorarchaeota archaeon]
MRRVLFLCTGNSARSQIAEALPKHLGKRNLDVHSAGIKAQSEVNPFAIEVLNERGVPTESLYPKLVNEFVNQEFDLVVTVCDGAKQSCLFFPGARQMEHWFLEDPAAFQGAYDEILRTFRETRNEIEKRVRERFLKS